MCFRNLVESFRKKMTMHTTKFCCVLYLMLVFITFITCPLLFWAEYTSEPYEVFNIKRNKTVLYKRSEFPLFLPFDSSVSDGHYIWKFLLEIQLGMGDPLIFIGK